MEVRNNPGMRPLQAGILQAYIDRKSEDVISTHQTKIDEHKQMTDAHDVVAQAKLKELEGQLHTFHHQLHLIGRELHERTNQSVNQLKQRFDRERRRFSAALPMYAYQSQIIDMVNSSQVSVLIGETGSGKSTQICQYLYEHGFAYNGQKIVCTQPRKVAASSLAEHVAGEMQTNLGRLVGYQVGVRKHLSKHTKIVYSTDHCLLNESLHDTMFSQYSVLVIDEAHERSIHTDLLIGLVKKCLLARPDLKVLITSATIDPQVFIDYFGSCPLLNVPGRMYPVEVSYVDDSDSCAQSVDDYLRNIMKAVRFLHETRDPGDILVFVVTPVDCEKCCELLADLPDARCLPLHGQLAMEKYQQVFEPPKGNQRKIIVATNCAETSITITGIKYVIDSGLAKEKQFDAATNVGKLVVNPITKSSANQRKGRAGRVESGECYRLYTPADYESMVENSVPEILRVNLRQAILYLIGLGITDPLSFEFVQSPSRESLLSSYQVLVDLGAIDVDGGLSAVGKQMVHIPIDPKLSKFVLMCCEQEMGFIAIVMAAMTMQGSMIFYRGSTDQEKLASDRCKASFIDSMGDSVTALKVYDKWRRESDHARGRWCFSHSINAKAMKNAATTIKEVHTSLSKECNIVVHREMNLDHVLEVMALFIKCHFPSNLCLFSGNDRIGYFIPELQEYCRVHPSSALVYGGLSPQFAMFENILQTHFKYLCYVSTVDESLCDPDVKSWLYSEYDKQLVVTVPFSTAGQKVVDKLYYKRFAIRDQLKEVFGLLLLAPDIRWYQSGKANCLELTVRKCDAQIVKEFIQIQMVNPILEDMRAEVAEFPVSSRSEVKVTVGAGALLKSCQMPLEFKSVRINLIRAFYRSEMDLTTVKSLLAPFGKVVNVKQVDSHTEFWGFAEFLCPLSAKAVTNHDFEKIRCNPNNNSKPHPGAEVHHSQGSICCDWLRMPGKGHAYVNFPDGVLDVFQETFFSMGIHLCTVKRGRRNPNDLMITGLPEDCTERTIEQMGPEILRQKTKLVIPRVTPMTDVDSDREEFRKVLCEQLVEANQLPSCLRVLTGGKANVRGFINLTSITACLMLYDKLCLSGLKVGGRRLKFTINLQYSLGLTVVLHNKLKNEIEAVARAMDGEVGFRVQKGRPRGYLSIKANDKDSAAVLYESITKMVDGHSYECKEFITQLLLSSQHSHVTEEVMEKTGALIECDTRLQKLNMYGSALSVQTAVELLDQEVAKLQALKEVELDINLRGSGRKPGLLKYILRTYRVDLAHLPYIPGCLSVKLDIRKHVLLYIGTKDGWHTLRKLVDDSAEMANKGMQSADTDTEDCPICLCPVDAQRMQLTLCGHSYCSECFTGYVDNQISEKKFPIICAAEACQQPVYVWDFPDIKKDAKLIRSTVDHYISVNQKTLKYCRSADCPNFYRKTSTGGKFYCSLCSRTTCTCCHQDTHADDIPCADAKDPDSALLKWMAADRENRHRCPKCGQGIEKDGGCFHVHCINCGAHICWKCKEVFKSGDATYAHRC